MGEHELGAIAKTRTSIQSVLDEGKSVVAKALDQLTYRVKALTNELMNHTLAIDGLHFSKAKRPLRKQLVCKIQMLLSEADRETDRCQELLASAEHGGQLWFGSIAQPLVSSGPKATAIPPISDAD